MGQCSLLACFSWLAQPIFIFNPGLPAQRQQCPQWARHPHIYFQENSLQICLQGPQWRQRCPQQAGSLHTNDQLENISQTFPLANLMEEAPQSYLFSDNSHCGCVKLTIKSRETKHCSPFQTNCFDHFLFLLRNDLFSFCFKTYKHVSIPLRSFLRLRSHLLPTTDPCGPLQIRSQVLLNTLRGCHPGPIQSY